MKIKTLGGQRRERKREIEAKGGDSEARREGINADISEDPMRGFAIKRINIFLYISFIPRAKINHRY